MPTTTRHLLTLPLICASVLAAATMGQGPASTATPGAGPRPGPPRPATPEELEFRRQHGIRNITVHDPSTIIKCNEDYWVFATGNNVPSWHSKDLFTWTAAGAELPAVPQWVSQEVPSFRGSNFWAPDIIKVKEKYLLFFSASAFGLNTSTIGVATNPTLDRNDPAYAWTDGGKVITSRTPDDFNAIDPAAILDTDGRLWLSFGSFWSGIKLIELDPNTGHRIAPDAPIYSLAHWDSIEASYIYRHDNHYFLFAALGMCCRGANSTYNTRVGRADKITGPYLDKDGKDMLVGGGTPFLATEGKLIGPGHSGILQDGDKYYYSCHYESTGAEGTFCVRPLIWSADGWPTLPPVEDAK